MTNATKTNSAQVATYIKSASHRAFGRGAWNTRLTRSAGHGSVATGVVVFARRREGQALASAARPCNAPPRCPHDEAGAIPCAPHTPGSSPPTPDGFALGGAGRDRSVPVTGLGPLPGPCARSTSTGQSAAPCRSARPRIHHGGCRRTPSWLGSAVELRLSEIRRRLAQNLVRPPELAVLPLQRLEPLTLGARQPGANPLIAPRAAYPCAQRLGRTTDLRRNRDDGRPLRVVLALVVQDQPHCPFPKLRGVSV